MGKPAPALSCQVYCLTLVPLLHRVDLLPNLDED
ncbi:hypothetical protein QFZ71_004870 [Streptomyces sp. V2I9]|nr:hypothetical protein [Streptomyces sp. V2I9]